MIIKTQTILKNLSGEDLMNGDKPFTLGEALGNILVTGEQGGKMKLYILGSKLYQQKNVEVDESDLSLIKSTLSSSKAYGALIVGQIELLLEDVKEVKKK